MGKKYQGVLTEKEEFLYPDSVSETLPEVHSGGNAEKWKAGDSAFAGYDRR